MSAHPPPRLAFGIAALVLGAFAMGASVLFVRFADVGPFASAFWRAALALPALAAWAALSQAGAARRDRAPRRMSAAIPRASLVAGLFFAGDLIFWHLAILGTSAANATVLATTSPLWVTLYAAFVLGARVSARSLAGLALCAGGALALVGESWQLDPDRLAGDGAGLVTALFFAGYFLAVRAARRDAGPAAVTLVSTAVTALALLAVALALEPTLWPASASGVAALLALALVSQVGGLGLVSVGLAAVPPVFGSLVFFLEVVSAAALGALFLGEGLSLVQALGAALVVAGLLVARPRPPPSSRPDARPDRSARAEH
ncbi:DMT family transporter [Xanthobacter tagetidis]|uniref:DMT family transporter n=1 Tax=Xanthobacter tagetidis TaxID=60216 RepID=A0A3L7AED9_9HYPH|nr:DMT family transporter [Xanthobacter tagetidis]MBB6308437.1 drug/metabolite transporter (DMT)-like permease [Xanthobacter tagetidis]RLP78773.1 DMT family transporter [Xanthobacter tagetidis]